MPVFQAHAVHWYILALCSALALLGWPVEASWYMLQHLVTDKNFSICMHFGVKFCVVVSVDNFSNFVLFVVFQCRGFVAPTFSPVVHGSSSAVGVRVGIHLALQPLATPIQLPFRYLRRLPQFQLVQTSASVRFMSLHHSCVEHGQLIMEEVLPGLTQEVAYQESVGHSTDR